IPVTYTLSLHDALPILIWPIVVGPARAKEILLIGDSIDAATAADLGVVNRVVAPADLADEALAVARRLAANPPLAVRATKAAVRSEEHTSELQSRENLV